MPPSIRLATVDDAPAIARVHVDCWRATYGGIVPGEMLDRLDCEERTLDWRQSLADPERLRTTWTLVAECDGEISGFADGGPERNAESPFDAELYAIYVLPNQQRAGIGGSLITEMAARLAAAGHRSLSVRVLAGNPSRLFYEQIGGQLVSRSQVEIGGKPLELFTYGWYALNAIRKP